MPTIYDGTATPAGTLTMTALGTVTLAGAEISAYDAASKRLFVTSGVGLQIVDLTNPTAPTLISTIPIATLSATGGDVTSVAVKNGIVAVAVPDAVKTSVGKVVLLNAADGSVLGSYTVGALPDMVTFSPDGKLILVANEGEPLTDADGTLTDPVGRVSVIDITAGAGAGTVTHAGFTAFNSQEATLKAAGLRIDAGKTVAQALEPEYIAISPDGTKAVITLQENNAFALLDLATKTITSIVPLGSKDYGLAANAADFSDRDTPGASNVGIINIQPAPGVKGLYMPDAIASFTSGGQTYYVTANEGDAYDGFGQTSREDAIRVGSATLDPALVASIVNASPTDVYTTEADIKNNDNLGRLNVSKFGDTDGDGDLDQLQAYGGRSFSIWDANGALVFDSGSLIERATAALTPTFFNANDGVASAFDTRSDDKAAEPEGVTVGTIGGKTYAFVALERAGGGVMAFDISNPTNVVFEQYVRTDGDISAEGVAFIDAATSPNGKNIVAVSNEVSGTVTLYQVDQKFSLQILHLADGEAGLLATDTAPLLAGLLDAFDDDYANTLILSGGDNWLPGPFLAGGTDISVRDELNAVSGSTISMSAATNHPIAAVDIAILNELGVEVSAIGNHEWDLGSRVFRDSFTPGSVAGWVGANFVHVSANLDFSGDADINPRFTNTLDGGTTTLIPEASTLKGRIAPSVVVTKGGEKIGIVGATTQLIESISSPSGTEVKGFPTGSGPNGETDNMDLLAAQLQPVINELIAEGVNKIVLMSHLQVLNNERSLATKLSGVDVILGAGSNTRLGDDDDTAVAFPGHAADFADTYPIVTAGVDGKTTVIVNTDNEYTYLGRLVINFDGNGEIIVDDLNAMTEINGAYAATIENVAEAWGDTDGDLSDTAFAEGTKAEEVQDLTQAVDAVILVKDGNIAGYTDVYLQGERIAVRNQETNLGNLSADANLNSLTAALGSGDHFVVSLKNGGGIRAQIGTISPPDPVTGGVDYLPPAANPDAGKPAGAMSQLDIENSLRFNNGLMAFDTTAAGLKAILEHGVAVLGNQGRYPQIGGVRFAYDKDLPAGSRVTNVALIDENDGVVAVIVEDGVVNPNAPAIITMVTLNFLAQGGDSYPMKANGSNFRYLLNDGTLSAPIDEAADFTAAINVPANILGEQQALTEYMQDRYATPATAFDIAETSEANDTRIQNLDFRADNVLSLGGTYEGTSGDDVVQGSLGDDEQYGFDGKDSLLGSAGNDLMDGGAGTDDTADYSASSNAVSVNLAAGSATTKIGSPAGFFTKEAAMLEGENGYKVVPIITVGDIVPGTTGALNSTTAGNYQPPGIMDGIGAYSKDASTVRVFVNQELGNTAGTSYLLESGVSLKGARISYFDIDKTTKGVVDAGIAYGDIYDRSYNLVTAASQLDNASGLGRFCSGSLYEANQFGAGKGVVDRIYVAGEESTNGTQWALDTTTGNLWAVPMMGRGGWENVAQVDTGTTTHVAFLLGDDGPNGMPLYLYVGEKNAAGDFLDKNGLKNGKMYVWKADTAGVNSPAEFASGTQAGSWVEIQVRDVSKAGTAGYDALGYKNDTTLRTEADTLGAFSFSRPEDLSTNPANGKQIAFASTGASIIAANTADGVADATDTWGTVYTMNLDFTSLVAPKGAMTVVYNGNLDANRTLRSPDNLDWADDGYIYINEDRSTTWTGTPNTNDASIVKMDPVTGAITRVAAIDRGAVPFGQTDGNPTDFGNWESSGILDVSTLFGETGGKLFLTDVQAHSINLGSSSLVEGSQLVFVAAPGVQVSANIEIDTLKGIENVVGTAQADQIIGSSAANSLYGGAGDDSLSGGAGDDRLFGGEGKDYIAGDAGNDAVFAEADDDYILGGAGNDSLDAGEGNDAVFGGAGNDYIVGGDGNDSIDGGEDDDIVFGGAGNNYVRGGGGNDQVDGGTGVDTVFGDAGNDIVRGGDSDDQVDGGEGIDTLYGDGGNDWLFGQAGNDTLDGGEGTDVLFGGEGDDTLGGGAGSDSIIGGAGNDTLRGGIDSDWFTFGDGWGADRVEDFEDGVDFINLQEVTGLTNISQLTITQVGADVQISLSGNTITIANTNLAQIDNNDLLL